MFVMVMELDSGRKEFDRGISPKLTTLLARKLSSVRKNALAFITNLCAKDTGLFSESQLISFRPNIFGGDLRRISISLCIKVFSCNREFGSHFKTSNTVNGSGEGGKVNTNGNCKKVSFEGSPTLVLAGNEFAPIISYPIKRDPCRD
jgi:hypothetical protein